MLCFQMRFQPQVPVAKSSTCIFGGHIPAHNKWQLSKPEDQMREVGSWDLNWSWRVVRCSLVLCMFRSASVPAPIRLCVWKNRRHYGHPNTVRLDIDHVDAMNWSEGGFRKTLLGSYLGVWLWTFSRQYLLNIHMVMTSVKQSINLWHFQGEIQVGEASPSLGPEGEVSSSLGSEREASSSLSTEG